VPRPIGATLPVSANTMATTVSPEMSVAWAAKSFGVAAASATVPVASTLPGCRSARSVAMRTAERSAVKRLASR
jgi:hypothetical protein